MGKNKDCFIDRNGLFQANEEAMATWFNQAISQIEKENPPDEAIPFLVFLMGCEAALRCQEIEIVH